MIDELINVWCVNGLMDERLMDERVIDKRVMSEWINGWWINEWYRMDDGSCIKGWRMNWLINDGWMNGLMDDRWKSDGWKSDGWMGDGWLIGLVWFYWTLFLVRWASEHLEQVKQLICSFMSQHGSDSLTRTDTNKHQVLLV